MSVLVDELLAARRDGVPLDLEQRPDLEPKTLADAYVIQATHVARSLAGAGGTQTGYKLGATSAATMQALGFSAPFHGPVLSSWTHASPATLRRSDFFICAIELEVGFRLGADLTDPDLDMQALRAAIAAVFPVLEIADSRYHPRRRPGPAGIVADLGNAGALITGAPAPGWRDLNFEAMQVTLVADGETVATGSGALVVDGGPAGQLLRFARERAAAGQPLKAGDIVSSGSCIAPWPARAGQTLAGRLDGLGDISLTLT